MLTLLFGFFAVQIHFAWPKYVDTDYILSPSSIQRIIRRVMNTGTALHDRPRGIDEIVMGSAGLFLKCFADTSLMTLQYVLQACGSGANSRYKKKIRFARILTFPNQGDIIFLEPQKVQTYYNTEEEGPRARRL